MSNPISSFLQSLKLNALPSFAALQHGKIVTVPKDAKIPETLQTLITHKITAVPVVEDDKPLAIVSMIELMNHFLNNFEEENLKREVKHTYDFFSLVISKKHVSQEKAADIKGMITRVSFLMQRTWRSRACLLSQRANFLLLGCC